MKVFYYQFSIKTNTLDDTIELKEEFYYKTQKLSYSVLVQNIFDKCVKTLHSYDNIISKVRINNKNAKQDVVLGEDGMPVADKRIEINSISFDDIELDFFQMTDPDTFKYEAIDPEGAGTTGYDATKLSWNGKTTLHFTTPIYIWLLENL